MTYAEQVRNAALEEAAEVARQYFRGMFTGWKGHTSESLISMDEAEDVANECGQICAEAILELKTG